MLRFRTLSMLAAVVPLVLSWSILCGLARGEEDRDGQAVVAFEPSDEAVLMYEESQRHRVTRGLTRQEHDPGLASIAQRVANVQASRGSMFHTSLGDNCVARGMAPAGMVSMWMGSAPHRSFLLSGSPFCGYGFARGPAGTFAAAIFRSERAAVQDVNDLAGIRVNSGGRFRRR